MAGEAIPGEQREAVLAALERLLQWSEIARSPQLSRFLDYIVRTTLNGDEQSIKAYSIAVDVFGRPAEFDPQADPIVRVQARRLRSLLDQYYEGEGAGESIRISLPTGRYIPEFSGREPHVAPEEPVVAAPSTKRTRLPRSWYFLGLLTLILAVCAVLLSDWRLVGRTAPGGLHPPVLTIVEFQNLSPAAKPAPAVSGLAVELVSDLEQFPTIAVRYGLGTEGGDDFVLTGIVRVQGDVPQYSAILTNSHSGDVVWSKTISLSPEEVGSSGVIDSVSRQLSLALGSPRGPLQTEARRLVDELGPHVTSPNTYVCRVLFDVYRETGLAQSATRAAQCVNDLQEPDRSSSMALAMRGILSFEQAGSEDASVAAQAHADLDAAIKLSPASGFAWQQRARFHEANGEPQAARNDYSSSIQLNPASGDALAAYARLLALSGDLAAAEPLVQLAFLESASPPPWYFIVPALLALRDGDYALALEHAEAYATVDQEIGSVLALVAAQAANESSAFNRYLAEILDVPGFRAEGVLVRLRQLITDDALLRRMRDSLLDAGLEPSQLTGAY